PDPNEDQILTTNSNGNLFVIRKEKNHICKYSYPFQYGNNSRYNFDPSIKLLHMEISKTSDVIYVCGRKHPEYHPFLAKSTDGGATYSTILDFDGNNDTYDISSLFHMSIINNGSGDIIKISGANKLIEYNSVLNNVTILSSSWAEGRKITFSDANNGFYMNADITSDEPPIELGNSAIYRTTNNGQNWLQSFSSTTGSLSLPNRFYSFGNVVYFTQSNDNLQAYFYSRNLSKALATYQDNILTSGSFKINNNPYTTTNSYIIRGGIYPLWTEPILNEGQSEEKLFYRWTFNNMSNSVNNYELFYDGELATHYKTKQKADNAWAINNANQTKAIRDTTSVLNGIIHQVHESVGGIFYTRSTNGGANWSSEEVVNNGFSPNDATGNRNPSVTIKRRDFKPLTISDPERNVAIVWERYNQSNGKIEILTADRVLNTPQTGYEWNRTEYENGNTVFASFDCSSYPSFISTPKIFVSSPLTALYESVVIVPHLEKNNTTGKVKVVVTIRYNLEKLDYVVDNGEDGMISNLAVSSPFNYFNNGDLYDLNIVYQKDNTINNIVYKKVRAGKEMIGLFADTLETEGNLGDGDGMRARFTPDITVQNGLPVVTYCGNYYDNRIVQYEDETGSDNMISLLN
uniref:hypothetical protein n=1 Tax=Flavobacterium filum TaxID=370974 RepID=UPI0023F52751